MSPAGPTSVAGGGGAGVLLAGGSVVAAGAGPGPFPKGAHAAMIRPSRIPTNGSTHTQALLSGITPYKKRLTARNRPKKKPVMLPRTG